ncbi:MAG TPA: DUF1731 domain-containing protein, partial [Beijerinckiaceae bacterium]|nr:DUF1731 domain-containing protein [Beijerinckiaceae bacterium]
ARELLLGGQRVLPRRVEASGFVYQHRTLEDALARVLGSRRKRQAVATRQLGLSPAAASDGTGPAPAASPIER